MQPDATGHSNTSKALLYPSLETHFEASRKQSPKSEEDSPSDSRRYGWTAEQTAVVPRLTSNSNCGKGKTGVVTWGAPPDTKFGVFCFNASGSSQSQWEGNELQ